MRFSFLSLLTMVQACQGLTDVYVVNNTEENITFGCTASNGLQEWLYWKCNINRNIFPGTRVKVATMNRDKGIKYGKTYLMRQKLSINGRWVVDLQQSLTGTHFSSNMKHSMTGARWYTSSNVWRDGGPYGAKKDIRAKWESFFTGSHDDLDYVIRKDQLPVLPSTIGKAGEINVASYNVYFMTNGPLTFNCKRARYIPAHVKDYDVIMFSEVWTTAIGSGCRDALLSRLKTHPYSTPQVIKPGDGMDGGIVIASKHEITNHEYHVFTGEGACAGIECLVSKGVMYASIKKDDKIYHFFGTHMQADSGNKSVRKVQLKQMKKFISDQNIPSNEPVIMGGDFNVDRSTYEYDDMLDILKAKEPYVRKGNIPIYSHDPDANRLASGEREDLDYVLVSKGHQSYNSGYSKIHFVKHGDAFKSIPTDKDTWDLSDHFPVAAHLDFGDSISNFGDEDDTFPYHPDGETSIWNGGDDDETLDDPQVFVDDDDEDNNEDSGDTHTKKAKHPKRVKKTKKTKKSKA